MGIWRGRTVFPYSILFRSLFLTEGRPQQKKPLYWGQEPEPFFFPRGEHFDIFLPEGIYLGALAIDS